MAFDIRARREQVILSKGRAAAERCLLSCFGLSVGGRLGGNGSTAGYRCAFREFAFVTR
jgi:hypothetical protein